MKAEAEFQGQGQGQGQEYSKGEHNGEPRAATVDDALAQVERLYSSLTGREPPKATVGDIPPERDVVANVEAALERLLRMLERPGAVQTWSPPIDLLENEQEYAIMVDLPGVNRGDVEVTLVGTVLVVSGQRSSRHGTLSARRIERNIGSFERHVVLQSNARFGDIGARMVDGVLEIHVPKEAGSSAQPTRRTINVT